MAFKKVEALRPSLRFDVVQAEQQQLRTTVYQNGAQHVQPTATSIQNIQNTNHCSLEKSKDLRGSFARASAISLASNSASKRRRAGLGGSTARLPAAEVSLEPCLQPPLQRRDSVCSGTKLLLLHELGPSNCHKSGSSARIHRWRCLRAAAKGPWCNWHFCTSPTRWGCAMSLDRAHPRRWRDGALVRAPQREPQARAAQHHVSDASVQEPQASADQRHVSGATVRAYS